MSTMVLHIKNMVCDRCIRVVRDELGKLNLEVLSVQLGRATVEYGSVPPDPEGIKKALEKNGFELLEDRKAQLVERIKALVIGLVYGGELEDLNINLSEYLAKNIGKSYQHLSSLFSSVESMTIEKFMILQKIERVKELLVYNEHTLSEIAYRMGYSSVQHLSNQFKRITGLTPSYFKGIGIEKRKPVNRVS